MFRLHPSLLPLLAMLLLLGACSQDEGHSTDEQGEQHYIIGRNKTALQDYKGAVEAFERALEANPKSAAAHFELAWIHEEKLKDFASAIYHYERHLRLRPDSGYADRARDRIKACKRELARSEVIEPGAQNLQREVERLSLEYGLLKRKHEQTEAQLQAQTQALQSLQAAHAQLQARAAAQPARASAPPPLTVPTGQAPTRGAEPRVRSATPAPARPPPSAPVPSARPRIHAVRSGETATGIARRYRVKLDALQAANPRTDLRRLKVGEKLQLPPSHP